MDAFSQFSLRKGPSIIRAFVVRAYTAPILDVFEVEVEPHIKKHPISLICLPTSLNDASLTHDLSICGLMFITLNERSAMIPSNLPPQMLSLRFLWSASTSTNDVLLVVFGQ